MYGLRYGLELAADENAQIKVSRSTSMKCKSYVMSRVFRKRREYISGLRARVKLLRNILRKLLYIRDNASHARYKTVYLKCIKR